MSRWPLSRLSSGNTRSREHRLTLLGIRVVASPEEVVMVVIDIVHARDALENADHRVTLARARVIGATVGALVAVVTAPVRENAAAPILDLVLLLVRLAAAEAMKEELQRLPPPRLLYLVAVLCLRERGNDGLHRCARL